MPRCHADLVSQVGVEHGLVLANLGERALHEAFALGHDDHGIAKARHEIHVVLDDEEGHAVVVTLLLDVLGKLPHQCPVDACRGLIEEDQARLDHQRSGEFQQLPLPTGEIGRVGVARDAGD